MFQEIVVHHLAFHFLELIGVVVVAVLEAGGLAVQVITIDLEVMDTLLEAHPGRYQILHAGLNVGLDALVPPLEGCCEVSAGQFFGRKTAGHVGAEHLHAGTFHLLLEDIGLVAVDEAIIVAGRFHGGVTHFGDGLQHIGIVIVVDDTAGRIHLHAHILLHGSRFLGGASQCQGHTSNS